MPMLLADKPIICGIYPKKELNWTQIHAAALAGVPPQDLRKYSGSFVVNLVDYQNEQRVDLNQPVEIWNGGTGFMMIKREVFEKFEKQYPNLRYKPDHVGQANFDGSRYIHAYFDTVIDTVPNGGKGSDRYLSEDYMFCQWWRNMGGQIWLCPWMKTHHVGTYAFTGDMAAVANFVGSL